MLCCLHVDCRLIDPNTGCGKTLLLHEFFSQLQERRPYFAAYYGSCLTAPLSELALRRLTRVALPGGERRCATLDADDVLDSRRRRRQATHVIAPNSSPTAATTAVAAAAAAAAAVATAATAATSSGATKLLQFFENAREKLALLDLERLRERNELARHADVDDVSATTTDMITAVAANETTELSSHLFLIVDELRVDGDNEREFIDALLRVAELPSLARTTIVLASDAVLASHGALERRFSSLDVLVVGAYSGEQLQRLMVRLSYRAAQLDAHANADASKALAGLAKLFVDVVIVQSNDVAMLAHRFNALVDDLLNKAKLDIDQLRMLFLFSVCVFFFVCLHACGDSMNSFCFWLRS